LEYLSDGMTETLINSLSQLPNLSVKARSTVFHYKKSGATSQQVGSELSVQAVLNGRVTQHADQLTLSLELVDARTGDQIWGDQYIRQANDLVALQNQVARDVANSLRTKLSTVNEQKLTKKYTENPEAYKLYLQGVFYWNQLNSTKAVEYLEQATTLDPNYALAYSGLGDAYLERLAITGERTPANVNETLSKARQAAAKALELDRDLPDAHALMGLLRWVQDHDFDGFEREINRALELNPNYAEGHRRYGRLLQDLGRFDEARISLRRALEIDPLSPVSNFQNAQVLFFERKYEESETESTKNVELDPNFWYAHWQLFYVYHRKRDYASAVEELAKVQDARGEPDAAKLIRESFVKSDWQGFLRKITDERARLKLYPYFVATFFAELAEKDKAFAMLNEAIETKDQHTAQMKVDPFMNPLRDDPRFQKVLKQAGFPE